MGKYPDPAYEGLNKIYKKIRIFEKKIKNTNILFLKEHTFINDYKLIVNPLIVNIKLI